MIEEASTSSESYDLAVVGGGSLGCAVAWEAASRGVRVVLLEQDDFGAAASANSLKIVHGGLRYLQKMDLKRARASAAERSVFLRIAPHLVRPLGCVLPTRRSLLRGRLAMAAGLTLNAAVTFDRNRGLGAERRLPAGGLVSRSTLAALAPGLNLEGVTAGAQWFDAQMVDSERLTLAFALGAESFGATLLNHHRVTGFMTGQGRANGVAAEDTLSGQSKIIDARLVADCRCAWSRPGSSPPGPETAPPFIKAVNVILPRTELECALGFPMRDEQGEVIPGRMLFATPWNGVTLVGTWYSSDARGPGAGLAAAELEAMLQSINWSYGGWKFHAEDIRGLHIGFLPALPESVSGDQEPVPMDKPRCDPASLTGGPDGLWYLQTEKWTTVRRLAQHFVDRLAGEGAVQAQGSRTTVLPLPGGDAGELSSARAELVRADLAASTAKRLEAFYGGRAGEVLASAAGTESVPGTDGVTAGEITFGIEHEHARTLGDVLRRTGVGSNGRPPRGALRIMAGIAAVPLGWDAAEQARQVEDVLRWPTCQFGSEAGS
jgi:glycerol-3-phosphate dehydrogenase